MEDSTKKEIKKVSDTVAKAHDATKKEIKKVSKKLTKAVEEQPTKKEVTQLKKQVNTYKTQVKKLQDQLKKVKSSELRSLKAKIESLKADQPQNPEYDELNDNIIDLLAMLKKISQTFTLKDDPITEKLNELADQNEKIAEAILSLAEKIDQPREPISHPEPIQHEEPPILPTMRVENTNHVPFKAQQSPEPIEQHQAPQPPSFQPNLDAIPEKPEKKESLRLFK